LPAIYADRAFVIAGGLISYAPVVDEYAPVKYETVLNLKPAKALGLTVPDLTIVRADEDSRNANNFGGRCPERSSRIEALIGLRMMPTFRRSPLSFRTASFPLVRRNCKTR
jgi:hypothetical protein